MHSTLFVIGKEKKIESFFEVEGFIGNIADYVRDCSKDKWRGTVKDQFDWLTHYLRSQIKANEGLLEVDDKSFTITFKKGFKEEYFHHRFEELKRLVEDITLKEFVSPYLRSYDIQVTIEDDHSFYICEEYYQTLDSFVRHLEDEDKTINVIQAFDYHF